MLKCEICEESATMCEICEECVTTKDSSGAKSVKSVKLEKSEQGDCQKLLVLCSEFLLEVLGDEVLLGKWMECD